MSRVPNNALVVVADGGKALILRAKTGHDAPAPVLHEIEKMVQGETPVQGPAGSRPGDQTVKQTDEAGFASLVAKKIESLTKGNDAGEIVLAADPQTLGQIRSALGKTTADRIAFTLSKDLTNHSLADIAKALH